MSVVAREVVPQESQSDSRTLMSLIERLATSPDIDTARIEKMLELKQKWDAEEARKAFVSAMAAFKENPPQIVKDKHVKFHTSKGITEYDHATLGAVCAAIIEGLSKVQISHRWDIAQSENRIKVTCILTHAHGHSESVSLHASADESGGKNAIQAIASTVSYLERYTLFAATGLAPMDDDDDGRASGKPVADKPDSPAAPEGYQRWRADMTAKAEEGTQALRKAWHDSNGAFRSHAATADELWWRTTKSKAAKASKAQEIVR